MIKKRIICHFVGFGGLEGLKAFSCEGDTLVGNVSLHLVVVD